MDGLPCNRPTAFTGGKGGNGGGGTKQNGNIFCSHLCETPGADHVAGNPGVEQSLVGEGLFSGGPFEKLGKDWTQINLPAVEHRPQKHPPGDHEEFAPELTGFLEHVGAKRFDLETRVAQGFRSREHRGSGLLRDGSAAILFKVADLKFSGFGGTRPAKRNRRWIRALHLGALPCLEKTFGGGARA